MSRPGHPGKGLSVKVEQTDGPTDLQSGRTPRPIPRQRNRRTGGRVTTFWDGDAWTYRVEGEPELGHHFQDRALAVAGGRYLAESLGAEHVIEDGDGSVLERVDCGDVCSCHPRDGARAGA